MNKKITRWSLMNILFAILVSIPLWSIVVRTGYVLLNKNANQSYYGETINEKSYKHVDNLQINNSYYFMNNDNLVGTIEGEPVLTITNFRNYQIQNINSSLQNAIDNNLINNIRFTTYNNGILMNVRDENNNNLQNFQLQNTQLAFEFDLLSMSIDIPTIVKSLFYNIEYNSYSYLDNVFDYSIDKFNSENNAHFDFVSNIANIFITEDSYGWRYVEFVNWYFNYFIVISACYILFLAIIWFIAVSRRLIERSMNLW